MIIFGDQNVFENDKKYFHWSKKSFTSKTFQTLILLCTTLGATVWCHLFHPAKVSLKVLATFLKSIRHTVYKRTKVLKIWCIEYFKIAFTLLQFTLKLEITQISRKPWQSNVTYNDNKDSKWDGFSNTCNYWGHPYFFRYFGVGLWLSNITYVSKFSNSLM